MPDRMPASIVMLIRYCYTCGPFFDWNVSMVQDNVLFILMIFIRRKKSEGCSLYLSIGDEGSA